MERCSYCGRLILFGAVEVGAESYCPGCLDAKKRKEAAAAQEEQEARYLQQAKEVYEASLVRLRERPNDPDCKQEALRLGRLYAEWTRHRQGTNVTLFDEVALANDLQAACAAAATQQVTPERRLQSLEGLREAGLLSEQEYQAKRKEIVDQL